MKSKVSAVCNFCKWYCAVFTIKAEIISYSKKLFYTFFWGKTSFITFGISPFSFWSNWWFIRLCHAFRRLNRTLSATIRRYRGWFIRSKTNYGIMREICRCRFLLMVHVKLYHFFQFRWMFTQRLLLESNMLNFKIVSNHDKMIKVNVSPVGDSCQIEPKNLFPYVANIRKLMSQSIDFYPFLYERAAKV